MVPNGLLAVCVLAFASVLHGQAPGSAADYKRFQLSNGLDVVLQRVGHVPVVTVLTTYRVGSANERRGRTGLAHLFEHLMFKGSRHVPPDKFAELLVDAGGGANASTHRDYTRYASFASAEALELVLYLDAERMGFLRDGVTLERLDVERNVVKNERRERMDNVPYGDMHALVAQSMYGEPHPYHWPTIGSMEDLDAATVEDVKEFHRTYYMPNNATLVVVGDIDVAATSELVKKWYGALPRSAAPPPIIAPVATVDRDIRVQAEANVSLPRLHLAWPVPRPYSAANASMEVIAELLGRRNGGLLRERLIDDLKIAQDLNVFQESNALSSDFYIVATARPGHDLDELDAAIRDVLSMLQSTSPDSLLVRRIINNLELGTISGIEATGGRAQRIAEYLDYTGQPNFLAQDIARYRAIAPRDLSDAALTFLPVDRRVALSIIPNGRSELGLSNSRFLQGAR